MTGRRLEGKTAKHLNAQVKNEHGFHVELRAALFEPLETNLVSEEEGCVFHHS